MSPHRCVYVYLSVCVYAAAHISAVFVCVIFEAISLVFGHISQSRIIQTDAECILISHLMAQIE